MDYVDSMRSLLEDMLLDENAEPTDLPLSVLKAITKDFSNDLQIGNGGFSVVYKGMLGNGRTVAVKKLSNSIDMDENKYNQEVGCLMRVRHKNIVRLLGYCADTQGKMCDYGGKFVMADVRQRLLCFEYLSKGSLEQYITDASSGLLWRKRYQIIKGICEGLHYLHANRIVHLDLKPANILLDDNMVPKIADFGLSRCFDENQTRMIASTLVGTMGYLAPEFFRRVVTSKLDIYSLGVIIIEILTGEKGYSAVESVLESWRNTLNISSGETVLEQVRVCTQIGIECMDLNPDRRPVTERIIEMLHETESKDEFIQTDVSNASEYIQTDMSTTSAIRVRFTFECRRTSAASEAEADIRDQVSQNPNNPVLELNRKRQGHFTPRQGKRSTVKAAAAAADGSVIAIHSLDEWSIQIDEANSTNKLVAIHFTASWCAPSRTMAPFFADLSMKFPNAIFLKVDVDIDEMEHIAEQFNVQGVPTFLFMKGGRVKDTLRGAYKEELVRMLKLQMAQ